VLWLKYFLGWGRGRVSDASIEDKRICSLWENENDRSENEYISARHISYPISAVNAVKNSALKVL
jgi:hypothetical protein